MRLILLLQLTLILNPAFGLEFEGRSDTPHPVIIELYTSQGCSSCPPAEAWLSGFVEETELWHKYFPLAFHVSYWDYLGWPDPFGDKRFGKRQYAHWNQKHSKGVYTPQIFIGGSEWRGGDLPQPQPAAPLVLSLGGGRLKADYGSQAQRLNLAIVGVGIQTPVARGENQGKLLAQDFAVLALYQFDNQANTGTNSQFSGPLMMDLETLGRRAPRLALVAWTEDEMRPLQALATWLTP